MLKKLSLITFGFVFASLTFGSNLFAIKPHSSFFVSPVGQCCGQQQNAEEASEKQSSDSDCGGAEGCACHEKSNDNLPETAAPSARYAQRWMSKDVEDEVIASEETASDLNKTQEETLAIAIPKKIYLSQEQIEIAQEKIFVHMNHTIVEADAILVDQGGLFAFESSLRCPECRRTDLNPRHICQNPNCLVFN